VAADTIAGIHCTYSQRAEEAELAWITGLTRMWANAQRDGRAAEYRWRPLFNAAHY